MTDQRQDRRLRAVRGRWPRGPTSLEKVAGFARWQFISPPRRRLPRASRTFRTHVALASSLVRQQMSNKGGNKREKFLESCRKQKLDTVRWSLGVGGQSPSVRDDDGYTAIMIAAAGNLHKVLRMLVDHTRKTREKEQMDLRDGAGDGRTALMMAAAHGHAESCQELLDAGCNFKLQCDRGKTAADYAQKAGHAALALRINRGGEDTEEDTDDEDTAGGAVEHEPDAPEGETATQRSKRRKKEMELRERRGAIDEHAANEEKRLAAIDDAEAATAMLKRERPNPVWIEVGKAIDTESKELTLTLDGLDDLDLVPMETEIDPATWWAVSVNSLKIELGVRVTRIPAEITRLSGLRTLILSNNALTVLPESIGELTQLKVLEVEDNQLTKLPESLGDLKNLENLRLANNALSNESIGVLAGCNTLVTLVIDGNPGITSVDGLQFERKERLVTLSAKRCSITTVPTALGKCALLAEVFFTDNAIKNLPKELGELKEKKVRALEFEGNPLADNKIKKMIGKSAILVKELLVYVRKNGVSESAGDAGGKNKPGGKGKKGKKQALSVSDASEEEVEEEAEAEAVEVKEPEEAQAVKTVEEKPVEPAAGDDSDSEDEDELRERMRKMSKKERAKAERKLVEQKAVRAAKKAAEKRVQNDATADVRRARLTSAEDLDDEQYGDIDSDDEEALLERKQALRKAKDAVAASGGAYTLTPEQRSAAEKVESERVQKALAEKAEAEAEENAKRAARDAEELFAKMKLAEAADGVVMSWLYEKGQIQRKPGGIPFKPGKSKGDHPTILCVIPAMIVGRIIGKAGATIREIETRSKAKVSIQEGKGGAGMSTLTVVGDDRAAESVRMMVNNAVGGGKR